MSNNKVTEHKDILVRAMQQKKPVKLTYNDKTRIVCPVKMGLKTRKYRKKTIKHINILGLEKQYGRTFFKNLISIIHPTYNWKGFTLDKIQDIEIMDNEPFVIKTQLPLTRKPKHLSTCIDDVEISVNIDSDYELDQQFMF